MPEGNCTGSVETLVISLGENEPSKSRRFTGEIGLVGMEWISTYLESIKESVEPESIRVRKFNRKFEESLESISGNSVVSDIISYHSLEERVDVLSVNSPG